jgi:hypothetical protein
MKMSATAYLPTVGSLWTAKDGRFMRLESWTRPILYPKDEYWATLTVLNPQKRQKHSTTLGLSQFKNGFLTFQAQEAAEG